MVGNVAAVISWGPVESLSNGYFVRTAQMLELVTSAYERVVHVELDETAERVETRGLGKGFYRLRLPDFRPRGLQGYLWRLYYYLRLGSRLERLLLGADVVLVEGAMLAPLAARLLRYRRRPLIVVDAHMCIYERERRRGSPIAPLVRLVECGLLHLADHVLALSEPMLRRCSRGCLHTRVRLAPFLLPRGLRRPRRCAPRRDGQVVAVMVGALYAIHNVEALLALVRCLSRRGVAERLRVYVVGSPGLLEGIVGRKKVWGPVVFTGFLEKDELEKLLCEADVLLSTSFTMSGVSTKTLLYLSYCGKTLVLSRAASEGLERLLRLYEKSCGGRVYVASSPEELCVLLERLMAPGGVTA